MWRWDQGRLTYFSLDKIRKIAACLIELDGVDLASEPDPLRSLMPELVELPFLPLNYRIWRNYARVFKILGLASRVDGHLRATGLCRALVETGESYLTYDEYLQFILKKFYFPSPAFQLYNTRDEQVFPFCAILKFLIWRSQSEGNPSISVDEVFSYLISNRVTGRDPIPYYATLRPNRFTPTEIQRRPVREMLIFISQLSFLSWIEGRLFLDPEALSSLDQREVDSLVTPKIDLRHQNAEIEIQNIFEILPGDDVSIDLKEPSSVEDRIFTEGRKVRITHLRTERNRKVVKYYFENAHNPKLCDICQVEVACRYPWLENLIEVHHILPLSSPLHVDKSGTSLADLVGLCPNCHRATHVYYRITLSEDNLNDFTSEEHARSTYDHVRSRFLQI